MSSSTPRGLTEIPLAIREQEAEIELIYRTLGRIDGGVILDDSPVLPTDFKRQEGAAWIFVAMLGSICIVALYLLWLKAGGSPV